MTAFMPRLVEIGVDIFHSAEPLLVWDLGEMKEKYGDQVTFMGGVDVEEALPGTTEQVVAEAIRRIDEMGAGGGYILAPSNHVQWDVSPQNLYALFDTAREYGRYPLPA